VRKLKFRTAASSDMRAISKYTRNRWGEEQTADYIASLRDQIKSLCEFPLRYPEFGYERLRKMNSGHHIVFYLVNDDAIEVVRVLHQAMDFSERLQ
jgi:toxin ParE1/3/4